MQINIPSLHTLSIYTPSTKISVYIKYSQNMPSVHASLCLKQQNCQNLYIYTLLNDFPLGSRRVMIIHLNNRSPDSNLSWSAVWHLLEVIKWFLWSA
jgi:hypothetical protein